MVVNSSVWELVEELPHCLRMPCLHGQLRCRVPLDSEVFRDLLRGIESEFSCLLLTRAFSSRRWVREG